MPMYPIKNVANEWRAEMARPVFDSVLNSASFSLRPEP
jgi:hypothetical protein